MSLQQFVGLFRAKVVRNPQLRKLASFLMVFGPGLIVMEPTTTRRRVHLCASRGSMELICVAAGAALPITYSFRRWSCPGIATGRATRDDLPAFWKWWDYFR